MFAKSYIDFMPKLKDSFESIPLDEIEKLSHRLKSLIIRNKRKIKDLHDYAQIFGSLDIVRGLEYHFDNFLTHLNSLSAKSEIEDDTMLDHEAIAYLGRLGQLYYFARSIGKISGCPKIKELYLFRRKIVGHRSIDYPADESLQEQILHTYCFQTRTFAGRSTPNENREERRKLIFELMSSPAKYSTNEWKITYQVLSEGKHADFTPQSDHKIICSEIENMYFSIFDSRKDVHL
jgi:hypothetical protein